MTLDHHPPPGTQCWQHLICYVSDFDQSFPLSRLWEPRWAGDRQGTWRQWGGSPRRRWRGWWLNCRSRTLWQSFSGCKTRNTDYSFTNLYLEVYITSDNQNVNLFASCSLAVLRQEINSYDKKLILMTRNPFLSQEINSCHRKLILVTRNQFLS